MHQRIAHTCKMLLLALAMLAVFPVQFRHVHHNDDHHACETAPGEFNWEEDCSICDSTPVLDSPSHFTASLVSFVFFNPYCLPEDLHPEFNLDGLPDYRGPPSHS